MLLGDNMFEDRHPGVRQLMKFFKGDHLPFALGEISRECRVLAEEMVRRLPDSPELMAGLRKLLEAKDCFVRSALEGENDGSDRG